MMSNLNAWREILARVFAGFAERRDVSPDWLVNPDTNRRLKLDLVYPDIGVAVRFSGLHGGQRRRRPSLQEERQQDVRDQARTQLCQEHGITLVQLDLLNSEPGPTLQAIRMALSDASRRLAQGRRPQAERAMLLEQISQARSRLDEIGRRVRQASDLRVFADLWQDRQFAAVTPAPPASCEQAPILAYETGMRVQHVSFGVGYVTRIRPDAIGQILTVLFEDGVERTFAAHLLGDKMAPCGVRPRI
jgi:hypothetical protein